MTCAAAFGAAPSHKFAVLAHARTIPATSQPEPAPADSDGDDKAFDPPLMADGSPWIEAIPVRCILHPSRPLHGCMACVAQLHGMRCTVAWHALHGCMACVAPLHGMRCTVAWHALHGCMACVARLHGMRCTVAWHALHRCVVQL